eukprot:13116469-Alexandrium_andersonii.AAC.1
MAASRGGPLPPAGFMLCPGGNRPPVCTRRVPLRHDTRRDNQRRPSSARAHLPVAPSHACAVDRVWLEGVLRGWGDWWMVGAKGAGC